MVKTSIPLAHKQTNTHTQTLEIDFFATTDESKSIASITCEAYGV